MMHWEELLRPIKYGDKHSRTHHANSDRSIFETDYDRIIFSTPFRRLQDKTQVIPLPENDFVHNRLTHSIEASSVGRTLGKIVGSKLIEKYPQLKVQHNLSHHDFGAIVAAAALAHDIGNPPFGHSGEAAISEFFLNGNGKKYQTDLTPSEFEDLTNFEGNANGFKILNNPATGSLGGMRLSYPMLATFTKYPKPSLPILNQTGASNKKYGYFKTEITIYCDIAEKLGLLIKEDNCYYRHPLAFLVEAADDICYTIIDFEDGIRLGLIDFLVAEKLLKEIAGNLFLETSYLKINNQTEKAAYLRAVAIRSLVEEMAQVFINFEPKMLDSTFDASLIKLSANKEILAEIKTLSLHKIYQMPSVLEIEAAGFEVLGGLLHYFTNAVNYLHQKQFGSTQKQYQLEKIAQLIPTDYLKPQSDLYTRLITICEYVAGLTDKHAINLYRKLKGIELPV